MSRIALSPPASGTATFTLSAPATNTDRTLNLPDNSGTVLTSASSIAASQLGSQFSVSSSAPSSSLVMDASGRATMPNQPAFCAVYTGAASNTASASDQIIGFQSTDTNIGSTYNTATGRFTAPVAGRYFISSCVTFNAAGVSARYTRVQVAKNGGSTYVAAGHQLMSNETDNNDYCMVSANAVVLLAANDYLEVYWATSAAAGQISLAGFNNNVIFSGYLVG